VLVKRRERGLPTRDEPTPRTASGKLASVSVWLPYWGLQAALSSTLTNAGSIHVANPFWDQITGVSTVDDESGGAGAAAIAQLHAKGFEVIPTVTETAGMNTFAKTLESSDKRAALIAALVSIAEQPGADGIDLDFENMAYGTGNPTTGDEVATLYPVLVAQLCEQLHASGRSCEVTVIAKNNAGLQDTDGLNTGV
jgi:hypothetical protein